MSLLKKIVEDMYIEPELLEQLGEEQKQILFRKIREEQIRKWEIREKKLDKSTPAKTSTPSKIGFLNGEDGNPWVWVMGEHKDDLSYEEQVRQRELKKQEEERRSEVLEAEDVVKKGLMPLIQGCEHTRIHDIKERRTSATESPELGIVRTESQVDTVAMERKSRHRSKVEAKFPTIGKTPQEQKKFEEESVAVVLGTLRRTRTIAKKRAAEMNKKLEDTWRESQRKANIYEQRRKRSFIKAREVAASTPNIHEKILEDIKEKDVLEISRKKPTRAAPPPPHRRKLLKMSSFVQEESAPKSPAHVLRWFKTVEAKKGVGKERDGTISVWFHGKLNRENAARLLETETYGSYLVRLSSKLWGYTVSVRTSVSSRHFLVDASSGEYSFLGPKQQKFRSLTGLLQFYKTNPITWDGQELLLLPACLEEDRDNVYGGLYSEDSDEDDDSSIL